MVSKHQTDSCKLFSSAPHTGKKTGLVSQGKSCDKKIKITEMSQLTAYLRHINLGLPSTDLLMRSLYFSSLSASHCCKHDGTNHVQFACKHSWDNTLHLAPVLGEQQCKIHDGNGRVHLRQLRAQSIETQNPVRGNTLRLQIHKWLLEL